MVRLYYLVQSTLWCLFGIAAVADAINCIQCTTLDSNGTHSGEACGRGRVPATPCANPKHTHCTMYSLKTADLQTVLFTWRKCGVYSDTVHPCKSHFIDSEGNLSGGTADADREALEEKLKFPRAEDAGARKKLQVFICVNGCDTDGCVMNSSAYRDTFSFWVLVLLVLFFVI